VAKLLKAEGFSLQANAKTIEGAQHPDRDAQFRYLNDQARDHIATADPVMVDRESRQINRDRTLLTNAVVAHGDTNMRTLPVIRRIRIRRIHDLPRRVRGALPSTFHLLIVSCCASRACSSGRCSRRREQRRRQRPLPVGHRRTGVEVPPRGTITTPAMSRA
jgi:Rhodopirellula transposase DDE domain